MFLITQRLVFESHDFNFQIGSTVVALRDIAGVEPAWKRFLNLIPLTPNSIKVAPRNEREHSFVVFDRGEWIRVIKIQSARQIS